MAKNKSAATLPISEKQARDKRAASRCATAAVILIISLAAVVIGALYFRITEVSNPINIMYVIIPAVVLLGVPFIICVVMYNVKNKILASVPGVLVEGLPIPAAVRVVADLYDNKIVLTAKTGTTSQDNRYFVLDIDKVQNARVMTEAEIQQIVSESPGLISTLVNGDFQTHEQIHLKYMLFIEYFSNDEKRHIILNLPDGSSKGQKLVNKLKELKPIEETPVVTQL